MIDNVIKSDVSPQQRLAVTSQAQSGSQSAAVCSQSDCQVIFLQVSNLRFHLNDNYNYIVY